MKKNVKYFKRIVQVIYCALNKGIRKKCMYTINIKVNKPDQNMFRVAYLLYWELSLIIVNADNNEDHLK